MFSNLNVRKKLLVGFGIILILTILIASFSMIELKKSNDSLEDLMTGAVKTDDLIKENRINTNIAARYLRDMVIEKDDSNYAKKTAIVQEKIAAIKKNFETLQAMDVLDKDELNEYQSAIEEWFEIGDKVLELLDKNEREEAQEVILEECTPALDKTIELVKPLNEETDRIRTGTVNESVQTTNTALIFLLVVSIGAVAAGILLCLKVTQSIVKPVNEVVEAMKGVANG